MESTKASDTAVYCAVQRAAHQVLDGNPKVLSDAPAVGLTPGSSIQELQEAREEHMQPMRQRTRSGVVLRSRFAENQVANAMSEGIQQYLILGAGFDTYAFRDTATLNDLTVFEVDHPATQKLKREYLASAGIDVGPSVKFCPVDFEQTTVAEGLAGSEFESDRPAVVSWLGVTMYLTRDAIEETLKFVLSLPSPSRVAMTFFQPLGSIDNPLVREHTQWVMETADALGEPMISLFTPDEFSEWLITLGFSRVEHFTAEQAESLYYKGRTDGLTPFTAGQNVCAYV